MEVSAIIRRADSEELEWKRKQVNKLVEQGLKTSEISFIKHNNIQNGHLDNWGLYLNTNGNNYQKPMRRERNEYGRGIMLYATKGVVCNRVPILETRSLELLCSELIVNKKEGDCLQYLPAP